MKKFVSILCIVVLLCTVFTGCGDNNKEEGSKPTNSQSQTSKTTSDKVKEEENHIKKTSLCRED